MRKGNGPGSRRMARTPSQSESRAPDAAQSAVIEPAEIRAKDPDLKQLVKRIRTAMGRVVKHAADTVRAAMDAGDALIMAKRQLAHGEWMDWLEKNCALSIRTASDYMRLAEGREIIEAQIKAATELAVTANFNLGVTANFTITRALGWLKDEKENVLSMSAKGKATIGSKKKQEPKFINDMTPEELLAWLVPCWPQDKIIKLAELITTQYPSEANK
jgi:hypothetical protein